MCSEMSAGRYGQSVQHYLVKTWRACSMMKELVDLCNSGDDPLHQEYSVGAVWSVISDALSEYCRFLERH